MEADAARGGEPRRTTAAAQRCGRTRLEAGTAAADVQTPAADDETPAADAGRPAASQSPSRAPLPRQQPKPRPSSRPRPRADDDGGAARGAGRDIKSFKHGDVVEGNVVRIDKDEILVDIGAKSEGVVSNRELYGRNAESQPHWTSATPSSSTSCSRSRPRATSSSRSAEPVSSASGARCRSSSRPA